MHKSNKKEWTVMFYLASDNPLAPSVVSQLKAIKQAGFHPDANVIAQFDPQTVGTPTHIFEVNLINKLKNHGAPNIGFSGDDPFIRNLLEDKLWRDQLTRDGNTLLRDKLKEVLESRINDIEYDPPVPPNDRTPTVPGRTGSSTELSPRQSLENFLRFCVSRYPAEHYMLFILGHGVIVGNDIFLFDEHADNQTSTLSLVELGQVLTDFTQEVKYQESTFELVGFHSCSVSSLEVAYELKGTANYMLASQGPAFVGSWPYRPILIRLFNDLVDSGRKIKVKEMLVKIFYYCLYNSSDFLLAGHSYDVTLCNLNEVGKIKDSVIALSDVLGNEGLKNALVTNLILLAHWRAQSFWDESYTDLYDFCFCLRRLCTEYADLYKPSGDMKTTLENVQKACSKIIGELSPEESRGSRRESDARAHDKIIVRTGYAGPAYQYSHGLSVYFPWSRPVADTQILEEYKQYKFDETSWRKFLEGYFDTTVRDTREDEDDREMEDARRANPNYKIDGDASSPAEQKTPEQARPELSPEEQFQQLMEDIASLVYNDEGQLSIADSLAGPKTDPTDRTGAGVTSPSIKNYPRDTRRRIKRGAKAGEGKQSVPVSKIFSKDFRLLSE
jgi:hypothetical protein